MAMRRGPNRQIFGEGWPRRYELPSSPNYSKLEFCRFVQYQWVTSKFAKNPISRAVSGARIALNETISRIPIFRKKISPMPSLEYPVVVEPLSGEEGGGFAAIAPDLPGCMSDGDTPEEALANVRDAIAVWIEAARDLGRPIPRPSRHLELA
jgi:antitoxin HicB